MKLLRNSENIIYCWLGPPHNPAQSLQEVTDALNSLFYNKANAFIKMKIRLVYAQTNKVHY